ncbi:zinc finger (C3HC4-type RING finger) family protein [Actinidia rufa]|uniref:Zinc finger (C3HC4-type RING finger) family protein n=1 Tax=Actinidia rufa TaxID=165716 RepID=A0A7J0G4Y8_9ERIC|nr:zinc finger (C3HC4-type RING finger) family protein [Actinidia rufa]
MGSKWRKVKLALGMKCVYVPRTIEKDERASADALLSPATPSSHGSKLSKSMSRSSKNTCSICLSTMKRGDGHAIFTAECSHSFHFHCIASNVKHGNQICPVCRAKWKEIPLQNPSLDPPPGRARITPVDWPQNDALMTVIRRIPPPRPHSNRHIMPLLQAPEPAIFDDDEFLDQRPEIIDRNSSNTNISDNDFQRTIKINTFPEVPAITQSDSYDNFTVLVHIKAPITGSGQNLNRDQANLPQISQTPRVPVDLVTVLDISGSMAGTKLALLKRAMGFVIQNLGSTDRLSVIAFSSTARRLFPLRRMSDTGRLQALQAVNSLVANGGTNIAEGLRKGAKVMEDRREKNPVASIILFAAFKIPVHSFGFGMDHDSSSMHSISEISGGTFSFIETESVIQDAFAQCIGGLLSVVVKDLQVCIECIDPTLFINSLRAGSYPNRMMADRRTGFIDVGDLYADEERDFLVSTVTLESEVRIKRNEAAGQGMVSIEVDRQKNRLQAADAMAQARTAAEQGDLADAVSILESCRRVLLETVSAKSGDRLCVALDAELKEMQERMASRQVYEASGRAYILSGLSSHSWQRATARGDSMNSSSLVGAYQTPTMTKMLSRSHATLLGSPSGQRLVRPGWSFASQPKQR